MYTPGKILVAGGAQGQDSAVIIDTATRQTVDTNPLSNGRRQHNLTILADGSVLATGGNDDGARYYSPTEAAHVLVPELWDPATQIWTEQNAMPTTRQYHSIALLLPDGQVLSAGGGICGDCYELGYEERNAEIFTPSYLFNADGTLASRPQLTQVPILADYGDTFSVSLDHTKTLQKVHLIKLGSVTHSENQDQRLVPLVYEQGSGIVNMTMPDSRHTAPPGHYLLFAVDSAGVPSIGKMLKLGQPLVDANQVIKTTLEQNSWDTYLTQASSGQFSVELSAPAATKVYVSASAAVLQPLQSDILCSAEVQNSTMAVCELDVAAGTQLYISVNGPTRAEYSLVYRDSVGTVMPGTQSDTTTPDANMSDTATSGQGANVDENPDSDQNDSESISDLVSDVQNSQRRSGGGSVTLFLLFIVLISVIKRPFSERDNGV